MGTCVVHAPNYTTNSHIKTKGNIANDDDQKSTGGDLHIVLLHTSKDRKRKVQKKHDANHCQQYLIPDAVVWGVYSFLL